MPSSHDAELKFRATTDAELKFRATTDAELKFRATTDAEPKFRATTDAEPKFRATTDAEPKFRATWLPAGLGAPTASAATVPTAAESTASRAGLRTRFVDRQVAASKVLLVQQADRLLRFFVRAHLDKPEPTRAAGGHVAHDVDGFDRAGAREQGLKILLGRVVREVSYVKFPSHSDSHFSLRDGAF
jgi:hypothetical protein